jgi:serine protease Do
MNGKKGTVPICAKHPSGRSGKWGLSPFSQILLLLACCVLLACRPALSGDQPTPRERPRDRGRTGVPNGKNDRAVKSAFQEVLSAASSATVRIRADGQDVALGAVVDADGYLVSKASLLEGKLTCRFKDGTEKEAKIVGQDDAHDLALLRVDAANLPAIPWRDGPPPPPGSLVATTGPADEPLALGAVSTDLRRIPGPRGPRRPKGWLGIELGGGESGTGIVDVTGDSPAAKAGLHAGDEIRQIDGTVMKSADQIVSTVGSHAPKQSLRLLVHREDKDVELSATLAKPRPQPAPQDEWGGGPFSERRSGFPAVLSHDTPLLPRDCGGPLVDTDGRVVGINIARALRVVTYALPAADVRQVVDELKRKSQPPAKP